MPGHAGSPFWAAVDFDSEGEENGSAPANQRVYLDPWDNGAYKMMEPELSSMTEENVNSVVGEPVSASFYYVPTKNYESEDEVPVRRNMTPPVVAPDYSIYGTRSRSVSRTMHDIHPEVLFCEAPIRDRRRSYYMEESLYAPPQVIYEPIYGPILVPPPPGYLPPRPRISLPHPDYIPATLKYGKRRKTSRMTDAYEHFAYDTLSPEYEDWARPFPKAAPDNFHLSRYGHLQIDYSCSWNSLDRLIRHQ